MPLTRPKSGAVNAKVKRTLSFTINAADEDKIKHEMAIEAALCDVLGKEDNGTPFGTWDYVSHQVAAAPFKPIAQKNTIIWETESDIPLRLKNRIIATIE